MTDRQVLDLGLEQQAALDLELVYVGDPMCSWCWGFSPVLEKLETRYDIPLRVVVGGLRTGHQAQAMDAGAQEQMATYWEGVSQRTGQPFTTASLERDGWMYDTEPSCRAVVTMRELAPHATLHWMARLHRAFYVEGVDVTDVGVFPGLLDGFDVDGDRFAQVLDDEATIERTRQDFLEAERYGVMGFPTVLFRDGDQLGIVTAGYVSWDQLEPALTTWLEERYGDLTTSLVCDPKVGRC